MDVYVTSRHDVMQSHGMTSVCQKDCEIWDAGGALINMLGHFH